MQIHRFRGDLRRSHTPGLLREAVVDLIMKCLVLHGSPPSIHRRGCDPASERLRNDLSGTRGDRRNMHDQRVAYAVTANRFAQSEILLEAQGLNRTDRLRGDQTVVRTAIINNGRVIIADVGDVRDVHRVLDDRDVPRTRENHVAQHRRTEVPPFAERIGARADVVPDIHSIADPHGWAVFALRRKRSPADAGVAPAPGNPGGPPDVIGAPDPADLIHARPTSVVVSDFTEILIGYPGPAGVGVGPVAIGVGLPVGIHSGWPKTVAVSFHVHPFAVRAQVVVEIGEIGLLGAPRSREQYAKKGRNESEEEQEFLFHGKRVYFSD